MTARAGLVAVVRGLAVLVGAFAALRVAGMLITSSGLPVVEGRSILPYLLVDPLTRLLIVSAAFAAAPWLAARFVPADAPLSPRALSRWVSLFAVLAAVEFGVRIGADWAARSLLEPMGHSAWEAGLLFERVVLLVLCAGVATAAWVGPGRCGAAARGVARWFDRWFRASRPRPDVAP